MILSPKDLTDILVIDALERRDPIRRAFEIAFKGFEPHLRDLNVKFSEVSNEEELVQAFNSFSGNIVIFDGHGGHEIGQVARLYLKDTPIDIWNLRGKLRRVPPIVILSACDTHAADRNHATTANGFLALGVVTVLASVFPLDALDAATFILHGCCSE
jgi:CHAT domain-containing protein